MKSKLLLFLCLATLVHAAELDEKSARYHAMLLKKPETVTLLSRFMDSWLETADQPALLDFLQNRAASGSAADWRVLAAFQEFTGNDAAALTALDSAVKLTPDDPATRFARAKILAKQLSIELALADLQLASKDPTLHLDATTLTGRLLAQAGRPDDALKAWDALLAEHPDDLGLHEDLIDLLLQENLADQALVASRKLTELTKDPYQKVIRRLRTAEILTLAGKTADAATEYAAILELSAQDSWLERETLALAQKLFATSQNAAGWEKFLTAAIALAPTRSNLHVALAQYHLAAGDTDKALKIHQQLLQTNPGSLPIRQAYIAILQQAGQVQQAAAELQLLAEKSPADPAIWQQLATIYQASGDAAKLEQALEKIIGLLPKDANNAIQTAQLYEQFQQPDKARKILEAAANTQGPQSDAADAFANFLARHQGLDQALALWTVAAKTADRENLLRISRALAANGNAAEAHAVLADRIKDFPADPLLLSAVCQAAMLTDQAASTIPHALALLDLAQTPTETQAAVTLATTLVHRAQLDQQTIDQLTAAPNPSTQRLCLLAQLHESLGDSLSAQKTLKQAAANDPNHTALYQQITLHETRGDIPAAITTLQELIALPGNRKPLLLKQLVALQRRAGKLADAVATTAEWKTLAPGDKSAFLTLSELQTELGDSKKATAELRRATAKFGNDAELRDKLVDSLMLSGSYTEALRLQLQLFDEADTPSAKLKCVPRVAETARILGRDQEIEELFRKRIRENPSATGPVLALRELFTAWQRQAEASELLAQAARLAPGDLDIQQQYAALLETSSQIEQAEALLLSLHQQHPSQETLRKLSSFYLRTGDEEKASALTRQAALQTTDPRQLETFVLAIFQSGNWQAALDVLSAAKPEVASDWRLAYLRGTALELLGQNEDALKVFVPLLQTQTELPKLSKPPLAPNLQYHLQRQARIFQSGRSLKISPEQQALRDFNQAGQTAYPIDPNTGLGSVFSGISYRRSSRNIANYQMTLPTDARAVRLQSLVHCIRISALTPADQRATVFEQLSLPEFTFLPGLLKIAALGESETLDSLLVANLGDSSLVNACMNMGHLSNFFAITTPAQMGRSGRQKQQRQKSYAISPATWSLVAEKFLTTNPGISFAASFQAIGLSDGSQETFKKTIPKILAAYRALPDDERKSYANMLFSYGSNFKRQPDLVALADEILAVVTPDLDPNDPGMLQLANGELCTKIQTAALAGDYATAVTHANEYIANIQATMKASGAIYRNQNYPYGSYGSLGSYGYNPWGGSGYDDGEVGRIVSHWELANSLNNYQNILQNATYQGCGFLSHFIPNRYGDQKTPVITPALTALLKELGESEPVAAKSNPTPPPPPVLTISDKSAFLKALENLSDPLLRLIILDALKFEPEVRAAIITLTAPDAQPTAPLLLWSAAYLAARPADLVTAYQLSVRAQASRPEPAIAKMLESQLLAIALKLDEKSRAAVDLDPARSLALRRAKTLTEESYRKVFAVHLTTLGLKDAAARLAQPASSVALARRAALSQSSSLRPSLSRTVTASGLIRQGNRPAAARLLYGQMATFLRQSGNYSGSSSEAFQQAVQLKLAPDIAQAMRPADTASYSRRAEFVKILCRIGSPKDFRADLEKLHGENPDDVEILSLYCAVADPAIAAGLFKSLASQPDNDLSELGGQLLQMQNESARTMEAIQAKLDRWVAVVSLLDSIPADQSSRKNLTWVNYHASQLANGQSLGSVSLPNIGTIYAPALGTPLEKITNESSAEDKAQYEATEKIAKLRDATLRNVATTMLKHPHTASQGFELLYTGRATLGLDDATLYQLALDALSISLPNKWVADPDYARNSGYSDQQRRWFMFGSNGYSASSNAPQGGMLPETFLANYASAHADVDVAAELFAKLPEAAAKPLNEWFVFLAKPTPAEAATRLKEIQSDPTHYQIFLAVDSLGKLNRIDTSPAFDLLFAALDPKSLLQSEQSRDMYGYPMPNSRANSQIIARWLNTPDLSKRWQRVHQLATMILGPERFWPTYASLDMQSNSSVIQPARQRLMIFTSFFNQERSSQYPANYLPQRFIRSQRFPYGDDNSLDQIYSWFNSIPDREKASRCSEMIEQLLATNLFLPGPGLIKEDGSLLLLDLARSDDDETRKLVGEALLKVTGPHRFWATLTGSVMTKQNPAAFLPLLQKELPSIKKWPDTEQMAFASFLSTTWPELEKSNVSTWLNTNTRNASKLLAIRLTETIQKIREGKDSNNQTYQQTVALLKTDPEIAITAWSEALIKEANDPLAQADPFSSRSSRQTSFTPVEEVYHQMFSSLSQRSDLTAAANFRLVLKFANTAGHRALAIRRPEINSNFTYRFSQVIQDENLAIPAKWKSLKDAPAAKLISVFDMLSDQHLADFPMMIQGIFESERLIHGLDAKTVQALEPWIKQDLEPKKPLCAKLVRFILAYNIAHTGPHKEAKVTSQAMLEAAHVVLLDPKIDASSRLEILGRLIRNRPAFVYPNPIFLEHIMAWAKEPTVAQGNALQGSISLVNELANAKSISPELAAQLANGTIPAIFTSIATNPSNASYQSSLLQPWLTLARQSHDKKAMEAAVAANLPELGNRYHYITQILLDGYPEIAATLVPKPHEISLLELSYLDRARGGSREFPFTKSFETALPTLLAAIPDPQQRYRVECLMNFYVDSEDEALKPIVPRAERIAKLIARFPTDAPPHPQAKLEILGVIGSGANGELVGELRNLCGNLSMGDIIEQQHPQGGSRLTPADLQRLELQLVAIDRLISTDLDAGDPTSFFRQAQGLLQVDENARSYSYQRLNAMFQTAAPRSLTAILYGSADKRAEYLKQVVDIASGVTSLRSGESDINSFAQWRLYLIFAHAAAGQGAALERLWQSQPDSFKNLVMLNPADPSDNKYRYIRQSAYQRWKQSTFESKEHPDAAKELLTALLIDPELSKIEIINRSLLSGMVNAGMFSAETVISAIDTVPDTVVRKPEYLVEAAGILMRFKKQPDAADKAYLKAADLAKKTNHPEYLNMIYANHAIMLTTSKRDVEARAISALVSPDQLDEAARKLYDTSLKSLERREAAAQRANPPAQQKEN